MIKLKIYQHIMEEKLINMFGLKVYMMLQFKLIYLKEQELKMYKFI
jgi:hypothetical protein